MKLIEKYAATALKAIVLGLSLNVSAHEGHPGHHAKLGKVHFPIECSAAAQSEFNVAMAYYHSFAWESVAEPIEELRGLAMYAEGKAEEALGTLRRAADREDATQKHVVTPGPIVPAREVLAQLLFSLGKPTDALREFETVLEREPSRYRAIAGAAQAAERAGDVKSARYHHAPLYALTEQRDTARAEISQAKRFLNR